MPKTADQAIYEVLAAHAGLAALVSDRIYPVEAPQGASLPMVVFQAITITPISTHDEGVNGRLDSCRYQLTALAETPLAAANVLYQARLALESSALKALQVDERSLPREELANCHGRAADFQIWNYPDA